LKVHCISGHLNIVELLIKKGAYNWNGGLESACKSGQLDMINLMIEKGANRCTNCYKSIMKHMNK